MISCNTRILIGPYSLSTGGQRHRRRHHYNHFGFYHIKQRGSTLPRVCTVIDHRSRQNVATPSVPFFPSHRILTSSVIYHWKI